MKNICLLGNSHTACLKKAWEKLSVDELEINFFAHQGQGMSGLVVKNMELVATNNKLKEALERSSGGISTIDPNAYDAVILVGLGLEVLHLNSMRRYSKAVIDATYDDYVKQTLLFKLANQIRTISDKSIYVLHSPLKAKKSEPSGTRLYCESLALTARPFEALRDVSLVAQPSATIVEDRFTSLEYSKSALKLNLGEIDVDYIEDGAHMNVSFGEQWLQQLIQAVSVR